MTNGAFTVKSLDDIAILIQARTSSQRCPNKMVKSFAGTTLMDICLNKVVDSSIIPNENIWVSIHGKELEDICSKYPINIFKRSKNSANSEGNPITEVFEWWDKIPYKYVVMINACVPFLSIETIEDFLVHYMNLDTDGMFGVIEKKNYFWNNNNELLTKISTGSMNTKTTPVVKEAAHCLYGAKLDLIGKNIWMGEFDNPNEIFLYTVPEFESFDIDHEWQFEILSYIYQNKFILHKQGEYK